MAGLTAALAAIAAKQLTAEVTVSGDVYDIKETFPGPAPGNVNPSIRWVQNIWQFTEQDDFIAQEVHRYDINTQWFLADNTLDGVKALDMVNLMWEHWLNLWIADQRFNNGSVDTVLSGIWVGGPALLEFDNKQYLGIDAIFSCQIVRNSSA